MSVEDDIDELLNRGKEVDSKREDVVVVDSAVSDVSVGLVDNSVRSDKVDMITKRDVHLYSGKKDDSDISDFYDNDMIHITKGILSDRYVDRGSCLSSSQFRFVVLSRLYEKISQKIYPMPRTFMEFLSYMENEVMLLNLSIKGIGLDTLRDSFQNRLSVSDIIKQKGKDKMDLEDH